MLLIGPISDPDGSISRRRLNGLILSLPDKFVLTENGIGYRLRAPE